MGLEKKNLPQGGGNIRQYGKQNEKGGPLLGFF